MDESRDMRWVDRGVATPPRTAGTPIDDGGMVWGQQPTAAPEGARYWENYNPTVFTARTTAAPAGQGPQAPGAPRTDTSYLDPALRGVQQSATMDPAMKFKYDTLLHQLGQRAEGSLTIDPNDAIIRNQTDAYQARAERARRNYLAETAEGSNPFASGKMRAEQRMSAEKLGQDVAGFEGELMGRELTARRAEIQHALDSLGNLLTENQRQALQRDLASADNALKRYGIDTQSNQFYDDLSQRDRQFYDELNQQDRHFADDNTYRYDALNLNDKQFGATNRLGYNQLNETARGNDLDSAARSAATGASWGIANMQNQFAREQAEREAQQWREKMDFDISDRQSYWDAVRRGLF